MNAGRADAMSNSTIGRWLAAVTAHVVGAWRTSTTRSMLPDGTPSQRSLADLIGDFGYLLLGLSVTHAVLLWLAPVYVRPFYGVGGPSVVAAAAVVVIACSRHIAAAWTPSALRKRLRRLFTTRDAA